MISDRFFRRWGLDHRTSFDDLIAEYFGFRTGQSTPD